MNQTLEDLRQRHSRFYYHSYSVEHKENSLIISFLFETEPKIYFTPEIIIYNVAERMINAVGNGVINNLAFHLGLMEIPSYWKATCSPEIVIKAGVLDDYQLAWWHDLLFAGMGEYFYRNGIDFTTPDFVQFVIEPNNECEQGETYNGLLDRDKILVPIGGGKDSAVTCELLKRVGKDIVCWRMNPTPSVMNQIDIFKSHKPITIKRSIDKKLLEINKKGYLNGHTPFSACLAFASVTSAILFNCAEIAISNERSSNEGNVWYLEQEINHQYSKSFTFEEKFRDYVKRYIAGNVNYFSLLRPLYEIQIAQIFSRFKHQFPLFFSCNKKERGWCHQCPKCLFVFTILYPFIEEDVLIKEIFSENIFNDDGLTNLAFDLLGVGETKPFECVGSVEECVVAFYLCVKKGPTGNRMLPFVLHAVNEKILTNEQNLEERTRMVMNGWNGENFVPEDIEKMLKSYVMRTKPTINNN